MRPALPPSRRAAAMRANTLPTTLRLCCVPASRLAIPSYNVTRTLCSLLPACPSRRLRRCISGTPLGCGRLGDLRGLLAFLNVGHFGARAWWAHALAGPFCAYVKEEARRAEARRLGGAGGAVAAEGAQPAAAVGDGGGGGNGGGGALVATGAPCRPQPHALPLLLRLVRSLAWRTPKRSVSSELDLPPQVR